MPLMVGNLINQIDREKSSTALSNCPLMLACYNHYSSAIFGANQQMHQASNFNADLIFTPNHCRFQPSFCSRGCFFTIRPPEVIVRQGLKSIIMAAPPFATICSPQFLSRLLRR